MKKKSVSSGNTLTPAEVKQKATDECRTNKCDFFVTDDTNGGIRIKHVSEVSESELTLTPDEVSENATVYIQAFTKAAHVVDGLSLDEIDSLADAKFSSLAEAAAARIKGDISSEQFNVIREWNEAGLIQ